MGKSYLLALIALAGGLAAATAGCQFFGTKTDPGPQAPGALTNGASVLGTWSASFSDTSSADTPHYAMTTTYMLQGNGSAQVEIRSQLNGGLICTGYGQHREVGGDVQIYIQSASPSGCGFQNEFTLGNVQVLSKSIKYTDPISGYAQYMFADNAQTGAPVGVWNFGGAGGTGGGQNGIDYLFLDQHGYFIMQTTSSGAQYLLMGLYTVASGALTLEFFQGTDPTQISSRLSFPEYVTDGQHLALTDQSSSAVIYPGTKL
jgi:hypothetical protein